MTEYPIEIDPLTFIFGGNAIFTIKNPATGGEVTFKVKERCRATYNIIYYVYFKHEKGYTYIGYINKDINKYIDRASNDLENSGVAVIAVWFFTKILTTGKLDPRIHLYYSGHCSRCGRLITSPESIKRGLGPNCYKLASILPFLNGA